ncbi:MAG: NfeD family protein [Planctomycetota bacterium]
MMMASGNDWWNALPVMTQAFYAAASVLSLLFLFQLVMALMGLGHHGDVPTAGDLHIETDMQTDVGTMEAHSAGDVAETITAFRLISVRSVLAFFTLFFWAGAFYMTAGVDTPTAMLYAVLWGLGAGVLVAWVINLLRRAAETGTAKVSDCLGTEGSVYLRIPAGGTGEVRVVIGGRITHLPARGAANQEIQPGAAVRVVRRLDGNTLAVEPINAPGKDKE